MKHNPFILAALLLLLCSCSENKVRIGEPLPAWEEGELDIHFINTGRGECTYQILPDGTTFLVDASGSFWHIDRDADVIAPKPSPDISAGKCIVDYINHFAPAEADGHVDYFLLTHHHGDHYGMSSHAPLHESGQFLLTSLAEVGSSLVLDRMMDRDYPDFNYPTPSAQDGGLENYKAFLDWTITTNGTQVEKWRVGSSTQVVPLHDPSCGVSLRSYSGNGRFWTGEGEEESYTLMPSMEEFEADPTLGVPDENCFSCSYILSYGDFDFFLGGDLQYTRSDKYPYMDTETPVGKVAHKVEVMEADHHGCDYSHHPNLLSTLRPDVWLGGIWWNNQATPTTVDRLLEANPDCDLFCLNVTDKIVEALGEERMESIDSQFGHIVIRVAPQGKSFMVYVLEDGDQEYRVKSIHGPYQCTE